MAVKDSLLDKFPEIAKEWHPTKNERLTPLDVTAFSNRFVWWQCEKGHEWRAMIYTKEGANDFG